MPDFHPILVVLRSIKFFYINPTNNKDKKAYQNTKGQKHDDFSVF